MSLRGALGWAALLAAMTVAAPVLLIVSGVRWIFVRANRIQIRLPSLENIGQGLAWVAFGVGVSGLVTYGAIWGYQSLFPSPQPSLTPPAPLPPVVYVVPKKGEVPPCLPITVGSRIRQTKQGIDWIPRGTHGTIATSLGMNDCKKYQFTAKFDGAEGFWCVPAQDIEPIECK